MRMALMLAGSLLLLAGCGGGGEGAAPTSPPTSPPGTTPTVSTCVTPGVSLTGSTWAPDAVILGCGTAPQSYDYIPKLALAANGDAVAAWTQLDGNTSTVWAIHFSAGTWGQAKLLDTVNSRFVGAPVVSIDANGNAFVVWPQPAGLWSSRYAVTGGWSATELLDSRDTGELGGPRIASDASGTAILVWEKFDGANANVMARRYAPGEGWGPSQAVEGYGGGNASSPEIAMDGSGNAFAIWYQAPSLSPDLRSTWAGRFTPAGGWGAAQQLDANDTALGQQIAFDAAGNALATWFTTGSNSNSYWVRPWLAGSGWGATQLLETDNWDDSLYPSYSLDLHGNVIALRERLGGSTEEITFRRYSISGGMTTEQSLGRFNSQRLIWPLVVAVSPSGEAIAVWAERTSSGDRSDIWIKRRGPSTGWGGAALLETDSRGSAVFPKVFFSTTGKAMAGWSAFDAPSQTFFAVARMFP